MVWGMERNGRREGEVKKRFAKIQKLEIEKVEKKAKGGQRRE